MADAGGRAGRAVRTYLDHLAVERGLAANTLSSYRRDLRRYLEFLDGAGRRRPGRRHRADGGGLPGPAARGRPRPPAVELDLGGPDRRGGPGVPQVRAGRRPGGERPGQRGQAADADQTAAEGAAAQRRRGDPRGRRGARHHAGAARPGPARGALRHRRPDLRGGGAGRRRPRHGRRRREAARQGRQGAGRPDREVRARGGRRLPGPRAARAGGRLDRLGQRAERCSSTPAAGASPGSPPGPSWSRRPSGPASRPTSRRTRCATRSRPTCSTAAPTSGSSRSCSGTRRSRRRRSTPWSPSTACARCSPRRTRARGTDVG